MPKLDKEVIVKKLSISSDKNLEYTILVGNNTYGIGSDNPNIVLVI